MISKNDINWVNQIIREHEPYKSSVSNLLADFPEELDCPSDLKKWICAFARTPSELDYVLNEAREGFEGRSVADLIRANDFDRIREFLIRSLQVEVVGPGSD